MRLEMCWGLVDEMGMGIAAAGRWSGSIYDGMWRVCLCLALCGV